MDVSANLGGPANPVGAFLSRRPCWPLCVFETFSLLFEKGGNLKWLPSAVVSPMVCGEGCRSEFQPSTIRQRARSRVFLLVFCFDELLPRLEGQVFFKTTWGGYFRYHILPSNKPWSWLKRQGLFCMGNSLGNSTGSGNLTKVAWRSVHTHTYMRLESIKAEFQTGLPLKLYGFVQNFNWKKNHIVSDFVFIHMSIPFRTSPFFFAPRGCWLCLWRAEKGWGHGGWQWWGPRVTRCFLPNDAGPVVGNFSGFQFFFSERSGSSLNGYI